jgi:hypothetical protein
MQIAQRPELPFGLPDTSFIVRNTPQEEELFQSNQVDMVEFADNGYPWIDAYLLAFGYKTLPGFYKFTEFATNAASAITGKIVVSTEDYLDHVYGTIAQEQEQEQLEPELPNLQENRDYKEEEKKQSAASYKLYIDACTQRKVIMAKLWDEYQKALQAKKDAEAFHKEACSRAYQDYMTVKGAVPDRNDYK